MNTIALPSIRWRANLTQLAQILAVGLGLVIPLSNALINVISVLLAITCLACMDKTTWSRVLMHPTTKVIFGFVALTLVHSLSSIGEHKEIILAVRKNLRLLYFPLLLPLFVRSTYRRGASLAFLIATVISVIAAIIYSWSFFKDTIITSLFVSFAIFMLLHYSVEYKRYRLITLPLIVFLGYYLFFIGIGRAGQLLCLMLCSLFVCQRIKFNKNLVISITTIMGVIILGALTLPSSFVYRQMVAIGEVRDYFNTHENNISHKSSMGIRLTLAHNSWHLVQKNPISGYGTGAFEQAYKDTADFKYHQVRRANPHNQYLLTWVELGLPGLVLLLLLFVTLIKRFLADQQLEGFLGVGLCFAMVLGCTMNSWLLDFSSAFFFIFFAALLSGSQLSRLTT